MRGGIHTAGRRGRHQEEPRVYQTQPGRPGRVVETLWLHLPRARPPDYGLQVVLRLYSDAVTAILRGARTRT